MKRTLTRLAALLLPVFFSLIVQADVVNQITVEGNKKTRSEIIQQEMFLLVGDEITESAIEQSRQAIMDLGLFQRVEINQQQDGDKTQLVVVVKEKKHDWYILPRIDRNADGDITLGINWRANNLYGLNQTSKLTVTHKNFNEATQDEEYRLSWKYSYPRIVNTQYSGFTYINVSQVRLDEERDGLEGSYDRQEYILSIGLGRWFSPRCEQGFTCEPGY